MLVTEDQEIRWTLDDAGDWKEAQGWQRISEDLGTTSQLRLSIESVYEGARSDWSDASLSEITFWELLAEEAK